MATKVLRRLEGLGICEHCRALLSMENMPAEAMNGDWRCPKCRKILTYKSFGYQKVNGDFQKVRWVGPGRKWTRKEPKEGFELGNWSIVTGRVPYYFY